MNFFGHAWVARWVTEHAPFLLGAMLPDFASMLRLAPPAAHDADLEAGIHFHHATDRAFHGSRTFQSLEQQSLVALAALGIPKGPRRALAHVGVELLIDEELAARTATWGGFAAALEFGDSDRCRSALAWKSADAGARVSALCRRLRGGATPAAGTRAIAARLVAALANRPRLALAAEHTPALEEWLGDCRPQVREVLPALLGDLARELGAASAHAASG